MTIGEISTSEGLSDSNVGKLLRILRLGGLIESERGREGGYSLAKSPGAIRVSDVIDVLGGRIVEEEFCARHSGVRDMCVHTVDCTVMSLWERVQEAIDGVLEETTLADLVPETTRADR